MQRKPHDFLIDKWHQSIADARSTPTSYRGYTIRYDPPPIPARSFDWRYEADGYDGAPDSHDKRHGEAASLHEAMEQIDEMINE